MHLSTVYSFFISNLVKQTSHTIEEQVKNEIKDQQYKNTDDEIHTYYSKTYSNKNERPNLPTVVRWYRNMMKSVKNIMRVKDKTI